MTTDDALPVTPPGIAHADGAGVADALERARATRAELVLASHAPATRRAYASDWTGFLVWCERHARVDPALAALPVDDATLSLWVGASGALRPATIKRKLAAIRLYHARAGFAMPDEAYPVTRAALAGHARRHRETRPRQMRAATDPILRALVDTCDVTTLIGLRNRALLLVGFDGAFRRSELVGIDAEHLTRTADGFGVHLPTAKGDQEGDGATVSVVTRTDSPWCPVDALECWLDARARPAGAVFVALRGARHVRHPGAARLSERAVARVVQSAATAASVPGAFGAHSLRRGLVTTAIDAGVPIEQVMRHVRHRRLETTLGYAEARQAEANHPRVGLGSPGREPMTSRPIPSNVLAEEAEAGEPVVVDSSEESPPGRAVPPEDGTR